MASVRVIVELDAMRLECAPRGQTFALDPLTHDANREAVFVLEQLRECYEAAYQFVKKNGNVK